MMTNSASSNSGTFAQRVEHKYWLPSAELDATIRLLQSFVPVYRYASSGWANVRTVCLDTPDLRCYRDYLDGLAARWKVRIRQYGDDHRFDDNCWVEIKMKNRGISSKRRFMCQLFDASRLVDGKEIVEKEFFASRNGMGKVAQQLSGLIRDKQLNPKLRIDYERLSFQHSPEDCVRITLDRNLRFLSANGQRSGSMQGLILELKYNGLPPSWFNQLNDKISLHRAHRFSKYARAVGALDEAVFSGAFA